MGLLAIIGNTSRYPATQWRLLAIIGKLLAGILPHSCACTIIGNIAGILPTTVALVAIIGNNTRVSCHTVALVAIIGKY